MYSFDESFRQSSIAKIDTVLELQKQDFLNFYFRVDV